MSGWLNDLIRESDVSLASQSMGLGPDAFAPVGDDDSRLRAMVSLETADFEACPGSGKTTLLVAKLGVLAIKWPHRQQGICVLSHTNAARNEIGTRLGNTPAGLALLRYPHFIGTIHSFVNEFLAVPWIRSKGNPVRVIDTQIALRQRMGLIGDKWRYVLRQRQLTPYCLTYNRPDFTGGDRGGLKPETQTYQVLAGAARESSESGFFCFDEMFVWANELLDSRPEVAQTLRARFPLIFIDEAQDNSEGQAALLHRIFTHGGSPARRQRFGDSNQAIYSRVEEPGAQIDQFPSAPTYSLPRSYRFGQAQADHVRGFGVTPQPLVGAGPADLKLRSEPLPPVLFVFDDQSIGQVLPRYAEHLVSNFSSPALESGVYTAVAGVHKLEKDTELPRAVGHYMAAYSATSSRAESSPESFVQYLDIARTVVAKSRNVHALVNALASGIFATCGLMGESLPPLGRKSAHRKLLEVLDGNRSQDDHAWLVEHFLAIRGLPTAADWNDEVLPRVRGIVRAVSGSDSISAEAEAFMAWPDDRPLMSDESLPSIARVNTFSYPLEAPRVHIRLSSIHAIKGETHTATLVLESFYFQHHLKELKPWILGDREGGSSTNSRGRVVQEKARMLNRLRLHYVAMTRPTHLLCLAMRKDSFSPQELGLLAGRGWEVVDCGEPT